MPNSKNTTWIVSCSKWTVDSHGRVSIGNCDGRSYRREEYARERYDEIIDSLKRDRYELRKITVPAGKVYEGVYGRRIWDDLNDHIVHHILVFIDRNPVWGP